MAYIETTTLSKTVFKVTVWIFFRVGHIKVNQTSKPTLNKQTYINQLLNSQPKHLTLRLCFQTRLYTRHKIQGSLMQIPFLNKRKPSCAHKIRICQRRSLDNPTKNSSETTFEENNSNFKKRLMDRGYPQTLIENLLSQINSHKGSLNS